MANKSIFACRAIEISVKEDYVELYNTHSESVDLTNWILFDDNGPLDSGALKFSNTVMAPGNYLLLCQGAGGSFAFGIGGADRVALQDEKGDLVSDSGTLQNAGSSSLTWQRKTDGSYTYAAPSPGSMNNFAVQEIRIVINEVSANGAYSSCGGTDTTSGNDFVELRNMDPIRVDMSGFILHNSAGPTSSEAFSFPTGSTIDGNQILLLCRGDAFNFDITVCSQK